jgi:hypothetical protein
MRIALAGYRDRTCIERDAAVRSDTYDPDNVFHLNHNIAPTRHLSTRGAIPLPDGHLVRKVFISCASEDKDFVGSLAEILKKVGIDVWYDEYSLKAGDSLMSAIDAGLAHCDFGIVALSKAFLTKKWTKRELRAGLSSLRWPEKKG